MYKHMHGTKKTITALVFKKNPVQRITISAIMNKKCTPQEL